MEEKYRRGRPVIKTTVELEKNLHSRIVEQAEKEGKSMRQWMTEAVLENLEGKNKLPLEEKRLICLNYLRNNNITNQIYEILDEYVGEGFAAKLIVDGCKKSGIDYRNFTAENIPAITSFIYKQIDCLHGTEEADKVKSKLEKIIT